MLKSGVITALCWYSNFTANISMSSTHQYYDTCPQDLSFLQFTFIVYVSSRAMHSLKTQGVGFPLLICMNLNSGYFCKSQMSGASCRFWNLQESYTN